VKKQIQTHVEFGFLRSHIDLARFLQCFIDVSSHNKFLNKKNLSPKFPVTIVVRIWVNHMTRHLNILQKKKKKKLKGLVAWACQGRAARGP
jgi:hypothetical protein